MARKIGAGFRQRCVAKQWRSKWGYTRFWRPARWGGFLTCEPNGFGIDGPILAIVAGKQPGAGFARW